MDFCSVRLVMLFYRYMLPSFTSEVYSWADPAEAIFGFKTGEIFRLSTVICFRPSFCMVGMYLNNSLKNETLMADVSSIIDMDHH